MNTKNPHCDHDRCTSPDGQIRKVPHGNHGANMLLCRTCFNRVRREMTELAGLKWNDLTVYPEMPDGDQAWAELEKATKKLYPGTTPTRPMGFRVRDNAIYANLLDGSVVMVIAGKDLHTLHALTSSLVDTVPNRLVKKTQ